MCLFVVYVMADVYNCMHGLKIIYNYYYSGVKNWTSNIQERVAELQRMNLFVTHTHKCGSWLKVLQLHNICRLAAAKSCCSS